MSHILDWSQESAKESVESMCLISKLLDTLLALSLFYPIMGIHFIGLRHTFWYALFYVSFTYYILVNARPVRSKKVVAVTLKYQKTKFAQAAVVSLSYSFLCVLLTCVTFFVFIFCLFHFSNFSSVSSFTFTRPLVASFRILSLLYFHSISVCALPVSFQIKLCAPSLSLTLSLWNMCTFQSKKL